MRVNRPAQKVYMALMNRSISNRGAALPASPIRKLVPLALDAKARGTGVLHLNIGQPDLPPPPEVVAGLRDFPRGSVIGYSLSGGTLDYVDAVRTYYAGWGAELSRDEVNVTTGGSEALLFTLLATLNPGDEMLICEPYYTNYRSIGLMAGVTVAPITTRFDDGFHLPPRERIEAAITDKTAAIVLCNPSNPTGVVYTRAELDLLVDIAVAHDLWIIADEVYREIVFAQAPDTYRTMLEIDRIAERLVVVDSVSKRFSLCGARVGSVVSRNTDVMDSVLRMSQARLAPPTLGQYAAQRAFAGDPRYIAETVDEYRRRRDVVYSALTAMPGVRAVEPEGAFYTIPQLPVDDGEAFARWLLTDFSHEGETVMVAPAAGFYATEGLGINEVRIAYVLGTDHLARAMRLLHRALDIYSGA